MGQCVAGAELRAAARARERERGFPRSQISGSHSPQYPRVLSGRIPDARRCRRLPRISPGWPGVSSFAGQTLPRHLPGVSAISEYPAASPRRQSLFHLPERFEPNGPTLLESVEKEGSMRSLRVVNFSLTIPLRTWRRLFTGDASNKLFVGGLSYDTNESTLKDAFDKHGEVTEVNVICDRVSGKSKGCGFVKFTLASEASMALQQMDGQLLDGRYIRVEHANKG